MLGTLKNIKYAFAIALLSCTQIAETASKPSDLSDPAESIYSYKVKSLEGEEIDLAQFKGKKILIVNTASECGFTPQYKELQKLHEMQGDKLVILGFPCNDFGGQEPGTTKEIGAFCEKNYGVTFQICEKVKIKGEDRYPLYKWLTDKSKNGWNDKAPSWNFCKYLINEKGELVEFYGSVVSPTGKKILEDVNK